MVDAATGCVEGVHPLLHTFLSCFVSKQSDPDSPRYHEAMYGPYRDEFLRAMANEITELEARKTWHLVKRSSLPDGTNVLPGTWVYKIKRYPSGEIRKFKARYCVRGDKQVEGVDFFDTYAPVVAWTTIRLMMVLKAFLGLSTKQVDFSNAFAHATLKERIFCEIPQDFDSPEEGDYVLELDKSLYGLRQAPLTWYEHLKAGLERHGFQMSSLDPCLFIHEHMICIVYVDDCLFFARDEHKIDELLDALKADDFAFTIEQSVEAFLGIQIRVNEEGVVTMTQPGLIEKILDTLGLQDCATKATPAEVQPLRSDVDGPTRQEQWNYASVVGMLMYVSSSTRPDIQFAVHQCARFTHNPQ
jgi:hypothetical protein